MKKQTILTLWKKEFCKNKSENFLWDNILGIQNKKDFIIKAYLIANYIKNIKGDYIGIMLPSVGSASLIIIATYLAGKIPVMFNWTLGKESFKHCKDFSKVENILTSKNFYDKVKNNFLEEYNKENTFMFLEDLLKNISLINKIKAFINSKLMLIPNLPETAVILFTSGSENLPKAVPLTHTNLIENIKGSLGIFELKSDDILLGFLPPFHSFGFTINTIMPLITGLKVVYTPDPNDAKTILEIIKHTSVTAITSTPTFLKMIMELASKDDLRSLKYVVVGAEKCSEEIFKKFSELSPNGIVLEGYGITECSPVVSINPIIGSKPGTVGKIIPNLDCKILDLNSRNEIKIGEQGMIYVSGNSIFNGYLDENIESPFEKIGIDTEGNGHKLKLYYKTGDLGFLDKDGFLTITGRLKRFIKIAGEMISLPFIEGILNKKYSNNIAIEALEKDGNVKIVLFTTENIILEEVSKYLRESGVSNLVKISEIKILESLPVLGTGKMDYKVMKNMISF
ncbi:MAG: AMP-binding protein [Candidatus Gracilibacteria bacterium]|nr:AMP-binding protein [Candidatus Gracilibacteria bacterium]